jgi:hypothetical protein
MTLKNQNFAIFDEVIEDFGRSDDDLISEKCLFLIVAYVVSCAACKKNLKLSNTDTII